MWMIENCNAANHPAERLDFSELVFLVENAEEGGFVARALGVPIFTQAEDLEELRLQIRDAVLCHFDDDARQTRTPVERAGL